MSQVIDYSLYPDIEGPDDLSDEADAADYIHRVCGAYDFGMTPDREVRETMRTLRAVFDKFPLIASPGYHAFRRMFGWPPVPPLPPVGLHYQSYDFAEGRSSDPCLELI